jgi:hypothetical protein
MAIYAAARRLADGLLTGMQSSPKSPDPDTMIAKGGSAPEWEYVELTQQQYNAVIAALPGRSFMNDDIISSAVPPQLTSEVTGAGEVTVSCDVGDVAYNGAISWECIAPDGIAHKASGTATDGIEVWIIQTGQIGTYSVRVDVELFGFAEITFTEA